jgi:ATP-binding cassette subfamily B (MDR/TAP) protein 1
MGIVFAKVMNLLTIPVDYWTLSKGPDYLEDELIYWVLVNVVVAQICLVGITARSSCFGIIGQNVTLKIRALLYNAILMKDIGFFDFRENNASVLTSSMAQDTSIINGASSESLGPYFDGFSALFGGIAMGFYFNWQMSLILLGLTPFMIFAQYIGMEF